MIRTITKTDEGLFNKVSLHPLQSWQWGKFREEAGNEVVRLGVFRKGKIKEAIQIIFSKIPGTNFKIGTIIKGPKPTKEIIEKLKQLSKERDAIFIKIEPNIPTKITIPLAQQDKKNNIASYPKHFPSTLTGSQKEKLIELLKQNSCVRGRTLFTPTTFWIDLTKSEEDLLRDFHPKTRYNIRLAEKYKVSVVEDNSEQAFERYIELTRETVQRQGFYAHNERYHRMMWKHLHQELVKQNKEPIARLLTSVYGGEIISAWIVFVWHDFLYYPYGASTSKYKGVMSNNLMMWEAIKFGKRLGLKVFDLWGRQPGKGFTKFKEGYNPYVVEFVGTWDLVSSPLYWPYRVAEYLRWKILKTKSIFIKPSF
jgi:lipid II:glycine glycyltransferase (peptidoglycan interpeptide bridge formation enzyme)